MGSNVLAVVFAGVAMIVFFGVLFAIAVVHVNRAVSILDYRLDVSLNSIEIALRKAASTTAPVTGDRDDKRPESSPVRIVICCDGNLLIPWESIASVSFADGKAFANAHDGTQAVIGSFSSPVDFIKSLPFATCCLDGSE